VVLNHELKREPPQMSINARHSHRT
jgi:hypothetical protein